MIFPVKDVVLRPPEVTDVDALYRYKNDPDVGDKLVGFTTGYSRADLVRWVEFHNDSTDEVLWVIANSDDECVGHVGLYQIDHRVGGAEFGILIGDATYRGRGLGRACTQFCIDYAFDRLNLNRVHLRVLTSNEGAAHLYRSLGFRDEGCLRQAQFRNGRYVDVLIMSLLRSEYLAARGADLDSTSAVAPAARS